MNTLFARLFASLLLAAMLTGCSTQVGRTSFPEPTAGFTPKASYAVGPDKLWDAVLAALERNRIAVASSDRASGTVQTDYIQGASNLIGLGFGGAQSTRYKFNIAMRPQADGSQRLNVISKLESSIHSTGGSSQWTDVSGHNPESMRTLETWLYQQIEEGL